MGIFSRLFSKGEKAVPAPGAAARMVNRFAVRRFKAGRPDRIASFPSSLNGHGI